MALIRFMSLTNRKQQQLDNVYPTIVQCGTMMKQWNKNKQDSEKTIELFNKLVSEKRIKHNFITCLLALGACSNTQNLTQGQLIHRMIKQNDIVVHNSLDKTKLETALINMFMKCNDVNGAEKLFEQIAAAGKDIFTYGAMLKGNLLVRLC